MPLMEPELDSPTVRDAVRMRAEGASVAEIAAHLGYNTHSVYRLLRRVARCPVPVKPAGPSPAGMAELVAAARPWAQRPWSAKGGS